MSNLLRALVLQNSLVNAALVISNLRRSGFDIHLRQSMSEEEFIASLDEEFDIILSDYRLPDTVNALLCLRERHLEIPFIIISNAVKGVQALISRHQFEIDYLSTDQLPLLGLVVKRALRRNDLQNEIRQMHLFMDFQASMLSTVRSVNRLIVRTRDPLKLFVSTTNHLVATCGYNMVWIGLIEEGHKRVLPVARAGQHTDYLDEVTITWDESDSNQEPTGTSVRTRRPASFHYIVGLQKEPLWMEGLSSRGLTWSVAVPLKNQNQILGSLTVYGDKPKTFSEEEVAFLAEMGESLALAVVNMENRNRIEQLNQISPVKRAYGVLLRRPWLIS